MLNIAWLFETASSMFRSQYDVARETRVKIAEAFSKKCPVISTSLGAFGYEVISRKEILLADGPMKFAADCLLLLSDAKLGEVLRENAWKKFLLKWTWFVNRRCSIRTG